MSAVRLHHVCRNLHVVENSLQLLSELVSTLHLQLGEHATFCIIRNRSALKKALRKVALIITFEDILVSKEPEDSYRLIQHSVNLGVSFLTDGSARVHMRLAQLTPLRPFFKLSSMNKEINSGAFSLLLTNDSKACEIDYVC